MDSMDQTVKKFAGAFFTNDDAHFALMTLREFFEHYFSHTTTTDVFQSFQAFLATKTIEQKLKEAIGSFPQEVLSSLNQETADSLLTTLEADMKKRPVMTLYIPVLLTAAELEKILFWAREEIQEEIYFRIKVDPKTIGGCAFVWNGVRYDYALKQSMHAYENELHEEIKKHGQ